jgi:Glu-tRNA(Gln) amidotransferase subunit E-like FAD-binding protein
MFKLNKHENVTFTVTFSAEQLAQKLLEQNSAYQEYKEDKIENLTETERNQITVAMNTVNAIMDAIVHDLNAMAKLYNALNGWVQLETEEASSLEELAESKYNKPPKGAVVRFAFSDACVVADAVSKEWVSDTALMYGKVVSCSETHCYISIAIIGVDGDCKLSEMNIPLQDVIVRSHVEYAVYETKIRLWAEK